MGNIINLNLNNGIIPPMQRMENPPVQISTQSGYNGNNLIEQYLYNRGVIGAVQINKPNSASFGYKNNLRTKFKNNDAVIMGVIIRNLGAQDNRQSIIARR